MFDNLFVSGISSAPLALVLLYKYSQAPLNGHPLDKDTSFLQTVSFVPRESPYTFSKFNPFNTDIR